MDGLGIHSQDETDSSVGELACVQRWGKEESSMIPEMFAGATGWLLVTFL